MDTLLLPNSAGGNCICVTLAGLCVVLSLEGKGCHLCRAADSEDTSAVLKAGPSTPPLPGLWFQVFLKDLPTSIDPAPVMRGLGLGLDSWLKPRQRRLGWSGGREFRMGQLPLEAAKMSLAAAGVARARN